MKQVIKLKQKRISTGLILFASLLWGTTGTAASIIPNVSPFAIGAFSMGIGGILLAIYARNTIRKDRVVLHANRGVLLIGSLALAVYPLAFYSSMNMAGVAIGTVISISCSPFFVATLECLFGKVRVIDRHWVLSFFVGILGIGLLVFSDTSIAISPSGMEYYVGIALGGLAGLAYAIYAWVAKILINKGAHAKSAMGAIFGLGSILLIPSLLITGDNLFSTTLSISVVLYLAFIPMFLGYVCFGYSLKAITASQASLFTLFEPVVAAIFAVLVVGERIEQSGWVGIGLIMMCLFLQSYQPKSKYNLASQSE
ncbi:DMT family transporter [Vibrio pectenicida]|uniref:DMT family transporter n=1 Tax=Vibrio pectenicida TaxID=62763 RepID=UPI003B98F670